MTAQTGPLRRPYRALPAVPIDIIGIHLNVIDSDGPKYAGFLFSTGAMPQITRYTTGELHRKGIGGSAAVLGGIIKGVRGDDETLMQITPILGRHVLKL